MINSFYTKDCLSFEEVDLNFDKGLNVFTGPSGAGKSILMESILSLFAKSNSKASLSEVLLINTKIFNDSYGINESDEIVIKSIKKEKVRFFLNNQNISKKNLSEFSKKLIKHLSLRDSSDFENNKMISFLDKILCIKDLNYESKLIEFKELFKKLQKVKKDFNKILEDEKKVQDLIEFAKFEIEKIQSIDPKEEEYQELSLIKKRLSKKEKIEEAIKGASNIFSYDKYVSEALELMEVDGTFFNDSINELNNIFEKFNDSLEDLNEIDIENVLDRIEKISSLQKRFGSIELALEYKDKKEKELKNYENISFTKENLIKEKNELILLLKDRAEIISKNRKNIALKLEEKINYYLKFLYLNNAKIELNEKVIDLNGQDEIKFTLDEVSLDTISLGEYNRLRLALLTSISEFDIKNNGILFLDEIDANLSGKESDAIAKVLSRLSKNYQIFAISHQPQLTSSAQKHFLVDKINGKSFVKELNNKERVVEVARMISGEKIDGKAIEFAKNLFKEKKYKEKINE